MPAPPKAAHSSTKASLLSILGLFAAWKLLLLLIVASSPGPGYDTSTQLFWDINNSSPKTPGRTRIAHLVTRLVRWDALYFVSIAEHGHVYEQDWAFGRGFMWIVSRLSTAISPLLTIQGLILQAAVGVFVAHAAHLITATILYALTLRIIPKADPRRQAIARLAAFLHIVSPAGVFLSAPYTESTFACLNFIGFLSLTYRRSTSARLLALLQNIATSCLAGLAFAAAATVRSNGLLSILALGVHALPVLYRFVLTFALSDLVDLGGLALGVIISTLGVILPQYDAYIDYCWSEPPVRPWCSALLPSIYSFVQTHYWGNGFLKYWTLPNLPLFLMAAPMLVLLSATAVSAITWSLNNLSKANSGPAVKAPKKTTIGFKLADVSMLGMALPQLVLTILNLTSFHVQIINRLSSGYPVWYIVLAMAIAQSHSGKLKDRPIGARPIATWLSPFRQRVIVTIMCLYAVVQAGLYSSFLPPA